MTKEIARAVPAPAAQLSVADQMQYAKMMAQASIVPAAYRGNAANILIAEGFGQAMGLTPAESLYRIHVIEGKPTMSAELVAAQVRRAGHKLRIEQDPAAVSATATIVRCDDPDHPYVSTWDMGRAEAMGLSRKDNYRKQPITMLTWRAVTDCARMACSEALFGMYTPDEMGAAVDAGGEAVEVAAESVEPQRRRPQAAPQEEAACDLGPVTALAPDFMDATGLDRRAANAAMCAQAGVSRLQQLDAEGVAALAAWMAARVDEASEARARGQEAPAAEPELLDGEVVF